MRVAALSYPMLTQVQGGLEIQILESMAALRSLGCEIELIDPLRQRMADFDLVHVFAAGGGNHHSVQFARLVERPVVLSPLLQSCWTRTLGRRARFIDRVMGRVTRWEVSTEYRDVHSALTKADRLVALGPQEKASIVDAFDIDPQRVTVIPNGIPPRFFGASPEPFVRRFGLEPGFALCVASIDGHKNQLGLARALASIRCPLVLVGQCNGPNRAYLEEVLKIPGTLHVGSLRYDDPLLASAYAAAGVFVLASRSEVMPLVTLEALAAGTPVVMTRHHGMDTSSLRHVLTEVDPSSAQEIAAAVATRLRTPPGAGQCAAAVSHLTWDAVARSLLGVYEDVLGGRVATAGA